MTEIAKRQQGHRGLVLRTLEDMVTFSELMAKDTVICPPEYRGKPESVFAAVQMGAELGLSPNASLGHIKVINGKATIYGDGLLAVCRGHWAWDEGGFKEWFTGTPGADDWTAHCQCRRQGGNDIESTFSVADARRAKLWMKKGFKGQDTPWITYPKRMLMWRARGFGMRDAFADALTGIICSEEAADFPEEAREVDSTVVKVSRGDAVLDMVKKVDVIPTMVVPDPGVLGEPEWSESASDAQVVTEEVEAPSINDVYPEPTAMERLDAVVQKYAKLPETVKGALKAKHGVKFIADVPHDQLDELEDSINHILGARSDG